MTERTFTLPAPTFNWVGFKGYTANVTNPSPDMLAPPSVNVLVTDHGDVETRLGYEDTGWNLNNANEAHTTFYHKTYDITFFAGGTKVYYIEHSRSNTVVDTGLSLTDGTTTRFAEYAGDVYLTNQTDGLRRIVVGRLNDAAANSGDANVAIDADMAARLTVFGINGSGNLRIQGTNEAYNAVDAGTGVVTLVGTLSQSYSDNAICIRVHDISSGREAFSKIDFWKERMVGIGSVYTTNTDQPNISVFFSRFTLATTLENIINFTAGSGATVEPVGKAGSNMNIVPTEDFLYVFKEKATYSVANADVNTSSGASIPNLRTPNHGCVNEDCAIDMGNGEIAYVTNDKRIMCMKISTESGAAVEFADESFDLDIRDDLRKMDRDQTGALAFYFRGKKQGIFQLKIDGVWTTFIRDNNIRAWQAPQTGKFFRSYFERDGLLYATDAGDDTIYKIDMTYGDNNSFIEHKAATGLFDVDDSHIKRLEAKGKITPSTTLRVRVPVNNADLESVTPKTLTGSSFSYPIDNSLSAKTLSFSGLSNGGSAEQVAEWKKNWDVFPSSANKVQIVFSSFGNANRWSWKWYVLHGVKFSNSFSPVS